LTGFHSTGDYLEHLLVVSPLVTADTVHKWIDEKGQVHYGTEAPDDPSRRVETLRIENTFDQQAYEEAVQRNAETEEALREYEDERAAREEQRAGEEADQDQQRRPPAGRRGLTYPPAEYAAPEVPPDAGAPLRPKPLPLPARDD